MISGILQSQGIAADIVNSALTPEVAELFDTIIYSKDNQNDKNVLPDFREGRIDAIVVAPGAQFSIPNAVEVSIVSQLKVAVMNADNVALAQQLWTMLQRDYALTDPRIAVVSDGAQGLDVIEAAREKNVFCYGPYTVEQFNDAHMNLDFDVVLASTQAEADSLLKAFGDERQVKSILGMPAALLTCPGTLPEAFETPEDMEPYVDQLRAALYLASDIHRNRAVYDEAHHSPLPKLYHERKDDSEKARFAVKKS